MSFGFSPGTEGISGDGERRHWWQAETLRFLVVCCGFFLWRWGSSDFSQLQNLVYWEGKPLMFWSHTARIRRVSSVRKKFCCLGAESGAAPRWAEPAVRWTLPLRAGQGDTTGLFPEILLLLPPLLLPHARELPDGDRVCADSRGCWGFHHSISLISRTFSSVKCSDQSSNWIFRLHIMVSLKYVLLLK